MKQSSFNQTLNPEQLAAVKTIDGPLLIIAGAGSGKTRVISYRIAYMLERGIGQEAILALTFSNKAAREMAERVKELTGKTLRDLTISTFHAFGAKILREHIETLGYRKNFSIYDEVDRKQLIKDSLRECGQAAETPDLAKIASLFSDIKIGRRNWESDGLESFKRLYQEYQLGLKVFNALDFDDLLVLPISLFESRPDILENYRNRYKYIMVDEFQDTSRIQYRLLRLLTDHNVCVVGDDDQSIYSWRGANYENILLFEKDFPSAKQIKLERNYRSTSTILAAANGIITHNNHRKAKQLWSNNPGGKAIEIVYPENETAEADFIAVQIKSLKLKESLRYDDFGILVRANNLMRPIEEGLLAADLPYRVSGGSSFFQRKEIKDILSYLRVIANPDDDINLLRIINTPRRGIGRTSVAQINDNARRQACSAYTAMLGLRYKTGRLFPEKHRVEIDDFLTLIEEERDKFLSSGKLSKNIRALIERIDYQSYIFTENQKNPQIARWKFMNLNHLIQAVESWEADPDNFDSGLLAYLNRISLITRDDNPENNVGKVNLMTIHAAKGLEFPVVFIAGVEEGLIPHARSLEEGGGDLEEERRLFYVAITRARDKLFLSSCKRRRRLQTIIECQPSPFLAEIPAQLIESSEDSIIDSEAEVANYFELIKAKFK